MVLLPSSSSLLLCLITTLTVVKIAKGSNNNINNDEQQQRGLLSDDTLQRPSIFTFFDDMDPGNNDQFRSKMRNVDHQLLDNWKSAWSSAGFEPQVLTLQDAERHPRYEEFMEIMSGITLIGDGTPEGRYNELCFLRWLAMASVGGGMMSDYDVFPVKDAINIRSILGDGSSFITLDLVPGYGGMPCLMFGSQDEWLRMSFAILNYAANNKVTNPHGGWSDMYSLLELEKNIPTSYNMQDFVDEASKILNAPLTGESCELASPFVALHFSHSSLAKTGHHIEDRPQLAHQITRFLLHHCPDTVSKRPKIHTFFDEIDPDNQDASRAAIRKVDAGLLSEWSAAWYRAGWNPQILTLADAKRHPNYQNFMSKLEQLKMIGEGTTQATYNEMCFIRWLAMASVEGGGFMSDYDTFPIVKASAIAPLGHGEFIVMDSVPGHGGIPSLMAGSQDEWFRMAFDILNLALENKPSKFNEYGAWSDFYALLELKIAQPSSYLVHDIVGEVDKLLANPYQKNFVKIRNPTLLFIFLMQALNNPDTESRIDPNWQAES
eukprot:CAMPEP_0118686640 /NCGR_PEP_ID=MMETSP0800-20121206/7928_1 /TAXON_ID=210618 ORGANISM="Striatella unipunctata, Strain CCMP2910" /NCGR_SAMPLE_ID=MMETSP0800 /ASSEMBLY_ACC=CAM_ASM_000638 /LENGTH=547 /DNA_ID=CAMNT_0006583713 /DNA_START=54 /DNA_END=1698 /DNA_ORIENTATION=+